MDSAATASSAVGACAAGPFAPVGTKTLSRGSTVGRNTALRKSGTRPVKGQDPVGSTAPWKVKASRRATRR